MRRLYKMIRALFKKTIRYRIAIKVTKYRVLGGDNIYVVCPRCDCTMERVYQRYCDRCGQRLNWKEYYDSMG